MSVQYDPAAVSHIKWNHCDGPLFCGKDGYIHWLTVIERLMLRANLMTIEELEQKYNHNPQRG